MEMLTCEVLMATWTQMQALSVEKRTGHQVILSLEKGDLYFNHGLFYFCYAFLRGGYFAVAVSHHSFEIPFFPFFFPMNSCCASAILGDRLIPPYAPA